MTPEQLTEARKIAAISAPGSGVALLVAHIDAQDRVLRTVERWANHHARKPNTTAEEALGVIQHHPAIRAITASYADGVVPDTPDPYAEIERLRADAERYRWLCAAFGETKLPVLLEPVVGNYVADHKPSIDAAIDAARKEVTK